jgi:hypothetical protein
MQRIGFIALVLLASTGLVSARIDPAYASNITVYHVNDRSYPSSPVDMNSADVRGDLYFTMRSKALPAECGPWRNESWWSNLDCNDPEVDGSNLAVTKLILEVDMRFGPYADCNPLPDGSYFCACDQAQADCSRLSEQAKCDQSWGCGWSKSSSSCFLAGCGNYTNASSCLGFGSFDCVWDQGSCVHNSSVPSLFCNRTLVGMQNCSNWDEIYARYKRNNRTDTSEVGYYHENVVHKFGGLWFSTLAEGQCKPNGFTDSTCSWRVAEVSKKISKNCSDASVDGAVMKTGAACFQGCPQPTNQSSVCWIRCFYQTVLGPGAGNSTTTSSDGMSLALLEDAWNRPFLSDDETKGGCKSIP